MRRALMLVLLLSATGSVAAERLPLGTLKKEACRANLYLDISAPQFHRVQGELRFCARLIDNRNGAMSRFWREFQQCSRYVEWDDAELAVEKSCR